jgi:ankyrin repeat protein
MEMAQLLLDAGAMVDVPGGDIRETPLHDAVQSRRNDIVTLLLKYGADPTFCNSNGKDAL